MDEFDDGMGMPNDELMGGSADGGRGGSWSQSPTRRETARRRNERAVGPARPRRPGARRRAREGGQEAAKPAKKAKPARKAARKKAAKKPARRGREKEQREGSEEKPQSRRER